MGRRSDWKPPLLKIAKAAGLAYALCVGLAMALEPQLIYHPLRFGADAPELTCIPNAEIHRVALQLPDGDTVRGWLTVPNHARAFVIHFHGNGGNIGSREDTLSLLTEDGVETLMLDYPGYGRSTGSPSERGLYETADAAWRYLTASQQIPAGRIVLFGESLGNAAALDLAARVHPAGVILQSAFTSMPDMAAKTLPWVPRVCVRSRMDNLGKIGRVRCPILIIHSVDDDVIPYPMARRLYAAATAPKTLLTLHGAHHNDTQAVGGPGYARAVRHFLEETAR